MSKRLIPALASIAFVIAGTGCTPEEIRMWIDHHDAPTEQPSPAQRGAPEIVEVITIEAPAAPSCADGQVSIESVGGPLCVPAIYVDPESTVEFEDPATCENGYYQGACI